MAKKKKEKIPILEEQDKIDKLIEDYHEERAIEEAVEDKFEPESKEYREFTKTYFESEEPKTFFEKACRFAGNLLNLSASEKDKKKLEDLLYFTGLSVKPAEIISLSIFSLLVFVILSGALVLIDLRFALASFAAGIAALVAVRQYPVYLQKVQTIEILNEMPLAVTYLVIFMRTSPELEGAVRFASRHLRGPLGRDMRKLLWDVESGVYLNMDEAMTKFSKKWKSKNKPFATALELIRSAEKIANEAEMLKTLNESASVMLSGNLETMKGFARDLRMPVMALYMLGIVLPIMGLVLAPVMATMLSGGMGAFPLVSVYNIILPLVIYFLVKNILSRRPGTFSRPSAKNLPTLAKTGHIRIGKHIVPLLPLSILLFLVVASPGLLMYILNPVQSGFSMARILFSTTIVWGFAGAVILYTLGGSVKKLKLRKQVEDIESSLDSSLYQLSEKIEMGSPIETAIMETGEELKSGAIKELFMKISTNMQTQGVTLERAIFDKRFGAIRYFPSDLLKTILRVTIDSTQKGLSAAANSLRTIAKFVGNFKKVKEEIEDLVGKTISSMKFQAQFLSAFMAGIIVSLDILLFRILSTLGEKVTSFELPTDASVSSVTGVFESGLFNVASVIPADHMQLIVGFYMVQVTIVISIMINGVMNGRDDIYRDYTIGTNLLVSTIVYTVSMIVGIIVFSGFGIGT
ncbi:MAG: type II secretion system F family protein [Candidatus Undinarchaeales archaeon]